MTPSDFSMRGAVDLGARKAATERKQSGGTTAHVIDVTEDTFNSEVVERSRTVPVIVDMWADWCQPCKQLSPILEKLTREYGGRFVLAKIDADANQRISQALQVQSLPTVLAVVGGQVVHGFQGALPEDQVRQWLDQLLQAIAEQMGGQGQQPEQAEEQAAPEPADPEVTAANEALDRGDLEGAAASYQQLLDRSPADEAAKSGLAQVNLLRRTRGLDPDALRKEAAADPANATVQCQVADLDMLDGRVEDAFDRLVGAVRRTSGDDREQVRVHLLGLFDVLPGEDQRVKTARASLASALF